MADHNEFYRRLSIPVIDDAMLGSLHDMAVRSITDNSFNWTLPPEHVTEIVGRFPILENLAASCNVPCAINFMVSIPPDTPLSVHLDLWPDHRKSAILVPVMPLENITPTLFYNGPDEDHPIAIHEWEHGKPSLVNVRNKWHAVENNGHWRTTLQIMLDADYETAVSLAEANQLFAAHDCVLV